MALGRFISKKLQERLLHSCASSPFHFQGGNYTKQQICGSHIMSTSLYTTSATDDDDKGTPYSRGGHVAVTDNGDTESNLSTKKSRKRNLWRNNPYFAPSLWEFFPSGLGHALMQATDNINKVFEKLGSTQVLGNFKEKNECYKLKYKMPGIDKEDVKITVEEGGVLRIRGEHKEEEEDEEGKFWAYYDTQVVLPVDAKIDEIKAEMKHGVLKVTVPRDEKLKKDVKDIPVH